MAKKSKRKKVKEIKLPMKFNVGLQKFEPDLPLRKTGKKIKLKMSWEWIIILIAMMLTIGIWLLILYSLK